MPNRKALGGNPERVFRSTGNTTVFFGGSRFGLRVVSIAARWDSATVVVLANLLGRS